MTRYEVDFLGCKISHTDAQTIGDALAAAGHVEEDAAGGAAVRVVNTCCITGEAERKSRQRVRRMVGALDAAELVQGRVFVTGCGAANHAEQYTAIDERVVVVPGAAGLAAHAIVEAADALAGLGCRGPIAGVAPGHEPARRPAASQRTRAFVKVQDGCDFHCSYCIVPTVRGEPRSRSIEAVLADVARRVSRGQREIVLTGVNIGLFRDPNSRWGLDRLLLAVADVDGVQRVRISSIESNHVNRRLVAAMASHPKVCPHLHVPLQSGDDAVLADMRRHYDSARYERAIEHARSAVPELNLTTDVIVGYPDEDDASFERTLALVTRLGITKVHAFPFSERPGTDAAQHRDPIDAAVKAERSRRLRAAADEAAVRHRARLVGRDDEVMVETRRSAGYGGPAGVVLSEDPAPAEPVGMRGPDARERERHGVSGVPRRTGYTRDYSPVRMLDAPDDMPDGTLVAVRLESLDAATGVLAARVTGTVRT